MWKGLLGRMVKTTREETKQAIPHLGYTFSIGSEIVIFDEQLRFTKNPDLHVQKMLPFNKGTFFEAVELGDGRAALRKVEIKDGQYRRTDK